MVLSQNFVQSRAVRQWRVLQIRKYNIYQKLHSNLFSFIPRVCIRFLEYSFFPSDMIFFLWDVQMSCIISDSSHLTYVKDHGHGMKRVPIFGNLSYNLWYLANLNSGLSCHPCMVNSPYYIIFLACAFQQLSYSNRQL